ncbi:hypothetical protein [Neolewinella antarctica]|uniref:Uncharacterized protein n=1 Tax=Neolewinella antarctica TaxID=442734 RepID=A0ABX0X6F2_9BACT|nr:hypothetical protein [Neolewinella antarctica]NJC24795.1 hypothetical protein [Neolewinella antarctica]
MKVLLIAPAVGPPFNISAAVDTVVEVSEEKGKLLIKSGLGVDNADLTGKKAEKAINAKVAVAEKAVMKVVETIDNIPDAAPKVANNTAPVPPVIATSVPDRTKEVPTTEELVEGAAAGAEEAAKAAKPVKKTTTKKTTATAKAKAK